MIRRCICVQFSWMMVLISFHSPSMMLITVNNATNNVTYTVMMIYNSYKIWSTIANASSWIRNWILAHIDWSWTCVSDRILSLIIICKDIIIIIIINSSSVACRRSCILPIDLADGGRGERCCRWLNHSPILRRHGITAVGINHRSKWRSGTSFSDLSLISSSSKQAWDGAY